MTTPDTIENGPESTAETSGHPPEGEGPDTGNEAPENGNHEAARRRRQLREVEAERDTLAAHLTRHRTRDLERVAGEHLAEPADLLALGGQTLDEFLTDDGDIDPDAVRAAARALVASRPGLRAPQRQGPIGQGRTGPQVASSTSWAEALGR